MCGINGIYKKIGKVTQEDIKRMSSAIVHRGPDEAGFMINKSKQVGLSNLRLSIMDLKNGHQPMYNEDNTVSIVFNGEVYDVLKHKKFLLERGHIVKTNCDTEIILHLYEEYGIDFLKKINGEFAFIIWDERNKKMFAVRDRFGIKPLFYNVNDNEILMSSEIKGILSLDRVDKNISPHYLLSTFMTLYSKEDTCIEGIKSIKPGHFLCIDENNVIKECEYWKPNFETDKNITFKEAKEGVRYYLEEAIKRRMVADVPTAVYLSGGIDSTLVCGIMSKYNNNLKAFNIGFVEKIFDESEFARKTAEFYDVDFLSVKCTMEMMAKRLEKTIYHTESAISNPHCVAKNMLSENVRKSGYKVCLTGEGSDEFFAGYPYFKLENIWGNSLNGDINPKKLTAIKEDFYKKEQASEHVMWDKEDIERDINSFLKYPSYFYHRANNMYSLLMDLFNKDIMGDYTEFKIQDILGDNFDLDYINSLNPINASRYMSLNQLHTYMIPLLGDRAEMANSVEGRVPFLDKDLVEFVSKLPTEYLLDTMNGLNEKYVLRKAFEHMVPPHMQDRKKHTFLSPSWGDLLETEYGEELREEYLSNRALKENGLFNFKNVKKVTLSREAFSENDPRRKKLDIPIGMVLSMQILYKQFIKSKIKSDTEFEMVDRSIK